MIIPDKILGMDVKVEDAGGRMFIVGGSVRDHFLGQEPKDFDLMVVGFTVEDLLNVFPNAVPVMDNVPVFIINGHDVALARREISVGDGKHAFQFEADPTVTVREDLERRDFTVNAMAFEIAKGTLIDPFGGMIDMRGRVLRPVSEAFVESPERVLRAASFAARLDFDIHPSVIRFADVMAADFHTIASEQLRLHFFKGLMGKKPSRFLEVLRQTEWDVFFPEIFNMSTTPQDSKWHPEGDVWKHTCHVLDASERDIVQRLFALTHDMGKASTTTLKHGSIVSPGHAHSHEPEAFLSKISCPHDIRDKVLALVRCHMDHIGVTVNKRFVRRLSRRIEPANIDMLAKAVKADHSGRPPLPAEMPEEMVQITQVAEEIKVDKEPVKNIVMGRHLIARGHKPGRSFGQIIDEFFEAQIEGEFETVEGAFEWAKTVQMPV